MNAKTYTIVGVRDMPAEDAQPRTVTPGMGVAILWLIVLTVWLMVLTCAAIVWAVAS